MAENMVMEKLAYDEKGHEMCPDIDKPQASLVLRGFTDKQREQLLKSFTNAGIKTNEHFLCPDGRHEYVIEL